MKKNFKYSVYTPKSKHAFIGAMFLALLLGACTKNFEKYNTDPTKLSPAQTASISGTIFGPLAAHIFDDYQRAQNLSSDGYSGFLQPGLNFGIGYNMDYIFRNDWNNTAFTDPYTNIMLPVYTLGTTTPIKTANPPAWAIALLIQITAMDKVTDKFGPIPYSKAGSSQKTNPYDSQQFVYQQFFLQIDTAVINLKAAIAKNSTTLPAGSTDYIYNGSYVQWLKYANSLRLRLAMRIVRADAVTAKTEALKAINDPGGLLTVSADNANLAQVGTRTNDLYTIVHDYDYNTNMDAAIASYMQGYNDPRFITYFSPATAASGPAYAGKYLSVRTGSYTANSSAYQHFASVNVTNQFFSQKSPQTIMSAAEVWFLRAEAALRGWTNESVQTDYETGIRTSMAQWAISTNINSYINDNTSTEANFVDPINPANSIAAVSTITIKWDNTATPEQMLERIITQKWLALFPDGNEAWADYRRTGYPQLFPVANNGSNGVISSQIQIRRLPYPTDVIAKDPQATNNAIATLLGGPDNGATRLWWDSATHLSNF